MRCKSGKVEAQPDLCPSCRTVILSLLLLGLSSCGGSGGASSGSTWPIDTLTITALNTPQIVGAAFDALAGGAPLTGGSPPLSTSGANADAMAQKVGWLTQLAIQGLPVLKKPYPKYYTSNCTVSGFASFYVKSKSATNVTYYNCSNVSGVTVNGTLNISKLVEDATFNSAMVLSDLTFTTLVPGNTMHVAGDMTVLDDFSSNTLTLSGSSLWLGNSDVALDNFELGNYTMATFATDVYVTQTYTFSSAAIGGAANFAMDGLNPFVNAGGIFPSSGVATITGTNGTMIRVTVLGDENLAGNQLQFEVSSDGGATYSAPFFDTWANISNLI